MSYKPTYINGSWKVICDVCGREYRASQLLKRWDGLMVCASDWEPRQPQDFVRGVADKMVPPYTKPEQSDEFEFVCTLITVNGVADYGVADCARADTDNNYRPECTWEGQSCVAGYCVAGCVIVGSPFPGMLT